MLKTDASILGLGAILVHVAEGASVVWNVAMFFFLFTGLHCTLLHMISLSNVWRRNTYEDALSPEIDHSKICTTWPLQVSHSATFIVDITQLKHPDDMKDFFGKWRHSGSHPIPFMTQFDSTGDVHVEKCAPGARGSNVLRTSI